MKNFVTTVFLFTLFSVSIHAQCSFPTPTITGTLCSGSTPTASPVTGIQNLKWYLNGLLVQTSYANYGVNGTTIAGGNGNGAAASQFNNPTGVFVDDTGNIYVCDQTNQRIQKWIPGAMTGITVAGGNGGGSTANKFSYPSGIFVDDTGNVYICDRFNNRIQKWAPGATSAITVSGGYGQGNNAYQLNNPCGVYVTNSGDIYISDAYNHRIQKWAVGATTGITVAGGNGAGSTSNQLWFPFGIFVDGSNTVYIADQSNHRIQKWVQGATSGITVAGGNGIGSLANQLNYPTGVFVDGNNNVYVCDYSNNRIQRWVAGENTGVTIAGGLSYGPAANQLHQPIGLFFNKTGDLFVSDKFNDRIQKWVVSDTAFNKLTNIIGGNYTVKATNFSGCSAISTSVSITPKPEVTASGATTFCSGGNVLLNSSFAHGNLWNTGDTTSSINITTSGNYSVTVTGISGCTVTSSFTNIIVNPVPATPTITGSLCSGATLTATPTTGIQKFEWKLNGNFYYSSLDNDTLKTVAGGNGLGWAANQLKYPTNIFVDGNGNKYICDNGNARIQKWAPGATSGITVAGGNGAGSASNQLNLPFDVCVDNSGNVYISDQANHRVQKWAPGATSGVTVAGGGQGSAALNYPAGIFLNSSNNLYICDNGNHRVQKWAPGATNGVTVAGAGVGDGSYYGQLVYPVDVYLKNGYLYISDQYHRIIKWLPGAPSGIVVAGGNSSGNGANQLLYPYGVYVDDSENVYICDKDNDRIQKWALGATTGTTVLGGTGQSQINHPYGIFVDKDRGVYITENGQHQIQHLSFSTINKIFNVPYGNYNVTATTNAGCSVTSSTFTVHQNPIVSISPTGSINICNGDSVTINSSTATSYLWNNGETTPNIMAKTKGNYYVKVTNIFGCSVTSDSLFIDIKSPPLLPKISGNFCQDTTTLFAIPVSGSKSLQWSLNGTPLAYFTSTDYDTIGNIIIGGNGIGSSSNQLDGPSNIFIDKNDNMYICDQNNNRIQKWKKSATFGITVAGGNGKGSASNQLDQPTQIFVDDSENVYVCDQNNHRVQKWLKGSMNGVTVAGGNGGGLADNQLWFPYGVFVDDNASVYVSDQNNHRIQKWNSGASSGITVAGGIYSGNGPSQLWYPTDIFLDDSENIYICDHGNNRIQKWYNNASYGVTIAGGNGIGNDSNQLNNSISFYLDGSKNVMVCDMQNFRVQKWVPGRTSGSTIIRQTINAPFGLITGIKIDNYGNIFLVDNSNGSIIKYKSPLSNSLSNAVIGTYVVTAINAVGCSISSPPIRVMPKPTIPIFSGIHCQGSSLSLTTITNLQSLQWNFNNNPIDTILATTNPNATTVAGGNGQGAASNQLYLPKGIFVTDSGVVYVCDPVNNRIQKWMPGATSGTTVAGGNGAGNAANQLNNPNGVFVDGSGNVYVSDYYNQRVQKWAVGASSGTTIAGGNGQGSSVSQLSYPAGIYVDGGRNVYIADAGNNRIQKWALGATYGTTIAGGNGAGNGNHQLDYPTGLFIDKVGNTYVNDNHNHRIQLWVQGVNYGTTVAGGNGPGSAWNQLKYPSSIYVDGSENVYVSDAFNNRIMKWESGASVGTPIAGSLNSGSSSSQLNNPSGIFLDGKGNMFVSDYNNNRIQKFSTQINGTFTPLSSGNFTVIATNFAGCSSISDTIIIHQSPNVTIIKTGNTLSATSNYNSYQWYLNGAAISGATSATFNALTIGDYYLIASDNNGCSGQSNIISWTNGIEGVNGKSDFSVYPNPNTGNFIVDTKTAFSFEVFDMTGKLMIHQEITAGKTEISLIDAADSIYFYRAVNANNEMIRGKILVER